MLVFNLCNTKTWNQSSVWMPSSSVKRTHQNKIKAFGNDTFPITNPPQSVISQHNQLSIPFLCDEKEPLRTTWLNAYYSFGDGSLKSHHKRYSRNEKHFFQIQSSGLPETGRLFWVTVWWWNGREHLVTFQLGAFPKWSRPSKILNGWDKSSFLYSQNFYANAKRTAARIVDVWKAHRTPNCWIILM